MDTFLHVHDRRNMALLQFLLEGYEGLFAVTTVEADAAIVKVAVMPDFQDDSADILAGVREILAFTVIPLDAAVCREDDIILRTLSRRRESGEKE